LDGFVSGSIAAALGRPVAIAVAVPIEFEAAFNRLYPEAEPGGEGAAHSGEIVGDGEPSEEDTERLKDLASEAPVIRLVNQLIARAVETGASDVHIEPFEDRLRIRYRYDGALHEAEPPPARLRAAVISRVKIMSRLDIAERRLPQDGRIRLSVRGQEVDFRVSTIPSLNGESVVLRVLDRTAVEFDFATLLRSILRHDPDVIMIGEIRDLETAQIAVQAALTGHLVLSTVHTNSAAATVTRLRDMGVEDYLLSATLKGVLAQRLVRRLCPKCKIPEPAAPIMIERFGLDRLAPPGQEISLYRSAGCP